MILNIALLLIGFILLHFGCSKFLAKLPVIATYFKLPEWFVSSLLLAFGTSLPEIVVVMHSVYEDSPDLGLSSIIGSNTANLGLAWGLLWAFFGINGLQKHKKMLLVMLIIEIIFAIITVFYKFNVTTSCILLVCLIAFIIEQSIGHDEVSGESIKISSKNWMILSASLISIPFGSYLVVFAAEEINKNFHVSQNFLGATVLAIGTSLPEIYTSWIALKKGQIDVAFGNIVGSNIINVTCIAALIGFMTEYQNHTARVQFDIISMLAISVLSIILMWLPKKPKILGMLMVTVYLGYLATWMLDI